MEKVLMIMNPYSGKRQANAVLADILELFSKRGILTTVEMTCARGDGIMIAKELAGDYDKVVCIGGDGTLNEVINGMLAGNHKTPIGYIPAGSTNDFATSMNIPKNIMQAALAFTNATERFIDAGKFGDRYFSYVASFGAFTRSSFSAPQNLKNALGRFAYFLEGVSDLSTIKPYHMKIELDGENRVFEDDYVFGAISNSTSVGGILSFDPNSVCMNDGKFEIFLVRFPKNINELNDCIRALLSQNYGESDMIEFTTASSGTVYSPENVDWTLDGEKIDTLDVCKFENVHNALTYLL